MRARRESGYTLIEMLIVVSLLGLIAAVAVPAVFRDDEGSLNRAADQVASAMRFAHAEAVRTGQPYGVTVSTSNQLIRLYRLDESVNPPNPVYDVRHPVTKQLYDLEFGGDNSPADITSYYFKFDGFSLPQSFVGFAAATGVPKYNDSGTIRMLESGYILLGLDDMTRTVSLAPMTGRVTIQ